MPRIRIQPGETVGLELTAAERKLVLDEVTCLDPSYGEVIQSAAAGEPVPFTLDELDDLGGYIAAEANHTENSKLRGKLEGVYGKILRLLETYTDEEEPPAEGTKGGLADRAEAVNLGEAVAFILTMADKLGIGRDEESASISLSPPEKVTLLNLPLNDESVRDRIREAEAGAPLRLTNGELAGICFALSEALVDAQGKARDRLRGLAAKVVAALNGCLNTVAAEKRRTRPSPRRQRRTGGQGNPPRINLTAAQRRLLAGLLPEFSDRLLLDRQNARTIEFSGKELASIRQAASEALPQAANGMQRNSLRHIVEKASDALQALEAATKVFQFRVAILDIEPAVWRRFQIHDGTLEQLNAYIQAAFGCRNDQLYRFEIDGAVYGVPEFLDDGFDDSRVEDSRTTVLSDVLPEDGSRLRFLYEYDFRDGWRHEILFEGHPPHEEEATYPFCVEGERACPPEDVGGPWGYAEFLQALSDPSHERYEEFMEWRGTFDPEAFDVQKATKEMRKVE